MSPILSDRNPPPPVAASLVGADSLFVAANRIEGVFWATLGVFCLVATVRRRIRPVWQGWLVSAFLLAFGVSDWVEAKTGAWYDPWWLFAWKACCVAAILVFLLYQAVGRRRNADSV